MSIDPHIAILTTALEEPLEELTHHGSESSSLLNVALGALTISHDTLPSVTASIGSLLALFVLPDACTSTHNNHIHIILAWPSILGSISGLKHGCSHGTSHGGCS